MQDNILIEMKGVQKWYGGDKNLRGGEFTGGEGEEVFIIHISETQRLRRILYTVFLLKKKKNIKKETVDYLS